jgi:hypothetical protein
VLGGCEVRPAEPRHEPPQRRNITVRPGRGSRVVVTARAEAPVPAVA